MPLGKDAYEKALGRKLTDEQYQKLSGAGGAMARGAGAYEGSSLLAKRDDAPKTAPKSAKIASEQAQLSKEEFDKDNLAAALNNIAEDEARASAAKQKADTANALAAADEEARASLAKQNPPSPPSSGMFVSERLPTKALPVAAMGVVPLATVAGAGIGMKTNPPRDASHTMGATLPSVLSPAAAPIAGAQNVQDDDYAAIIAANRKKLGL